MPKRSPDDLVRQAVDAVLALPDHADRAVAATKLLAALDDARTQLAAARHESTGKLKAEGYTLAQLGELLGVSRSRAQQIVEGLSRSTAARSTPAAKRGET